MLVQEDVSNDVIIKYCQKLQLMEKEIEAEANNQSPNNHVINNQNNESVSSNFGELFLSNCCVK